MHFVIRLNNSGIQPSIEVELNGEIEFTHWISTLDSLTLNGGLGDDTFTIEGWNSSIDLEINGSCGDDVVSVLPGVRNIEVVNGMTFDGGWGTDSLVVNDQSNPYSNAAYSRIYTVSGGAVVAVRRTPRVPRQPGAFIPVAIGFSGVENLDVTTGGPERRRERREQNFRRDPRPHRLGRRCDHRRADGRQHRDGRRPGSRRPGGLGHDSPVRPQQDERRSSSDWPVRRRRDSVSRYIASLGGIANGEPEGVGVEYSHVENLELTTTDLVDVIRVHATPTGADHDPRRRRRRHSQCQPRRQESRTGRRPGFPRRRGARRDRSQRSEQSVQPSGALAAFTSVTAAGVARSAAMPGQPVCDSRPDQRRVQQRRRADAQDGRPGRRGERGKRPVSRRPDSDRLGQRRRQREPDGSQFRDRQRP